MIEQIIGERGMCTLLFLAGLLETTVTRVLDFNLMRKVKWESEPMLTPKEKAPPPPPPPPTGGLEEDRTRDAASRLGSTKCMGWMYRWMGRQTVQPFSRLTKSQDYWMFLLEILFLRLLRYVKYVFPMMVMLQCSLVFTVPHLVDRIG